jgi:lycopene beta-cyclase
MLPDIRCDLAIIGGGLAGGLIAYALATKRPDLRVRLIEARETLGGNHIWSFFSNDIEPEDRWLVEPFVSRTWNGYAVRFPRHRRELGVQYNSIRSEQFDRVLREKLSADSVIHGKTSYIRRNGVALENGQLVRAHGVIDVRGPARLRTLDLGWQKFLGQELRLSAPHRIEQPIVMDATVSQEDGYRFVYVLPFARDRLFVEDTYYSDRKTVNRDLLAGRIADYAAAQGWQVAEVLREETGSLPVAMGGDFEAYWNSGGYGIAKAGMRAALFHPTTGYSLPDAVRTAAFVAGLDDFDGKSLHDTLLERARGVWEERSFYRLLDRMLFRAAKPAERYKVLERFYRLNPALIGRFYAARSTGLDKVKILAGKPPVPVGDALRVLAEKRP